VCLRIQLSRATVKKLHRRLQPAYQRSEVRLVQHITVLLDLLIHHMPVEVLCVQWGLSPACIYGEAAGLPAAQHDQFGLSPWWWSPPEPEGNAEEALGRADRGWAACRGL
jgi:hypothetical protein